MSNTLEVLTDIAQKEPLEAAKRELVTARLASEESTSASNETEEGADRAAELVRNYLDLQVSKSGGLLTFNGLAVAVATILWTNPAMSVAVWLPVSLFGALFLSSLGSLFAILVWWERPSVYSSASEELTHLLRFTALRGWAINVAVLLSLVSVVLIGLWLYSADRRVAPSEVAPFGASLYFGSVTIGHEALR